jgi:CheY-like chemotaxis protein
MGKMKTVLLIDDDADDIEFFCEAVNMIDKNIVCIPSVDSEVALHAIKQKGIVLPDLIFLDLNMPKIDGREFLSELKRTDPYSQVPVIMYSTSSFDKDIEDTKKLGASFFLTKPNSLKELRENLVELFSFDWSEAKTELSSAK